jgi:tetracycline resistance efflux pump
MTAIHVEHCGLFSILPAFLAIVLAIKTRRVIESALCGIGLGAAIIDYHANGFVHSVCYCIPNTLMALAGHATTATIKGVGLIKDASRAQLFIGVLLLGAFVTVIEKSGGCQAFAQRSVKHIHRER